MKHIKLFEAFIPKKFDSSLVDTNEVRNSFPYLEMVRKGFTEESPNMFDITGKLFLYNGKNDPSHSAGVSISKHGGIRASKPGRSMELPEIPRRPILYTEDYITALEEVNKLLDINPDALNLYKRRRG